MAGSVLLLGGLLFSILPASRVGAAPTSEGRPQGAISYSDLSALSVVDRVESEREDLARVTTEIELHYGTVKSRSIANALRGIARSLTPFLLHPAFPVEVILIDADKPAGFYLGGETVVLTRGLVFSGLIHDTDTLAGIIALLLSRHDLLDDSSGQFLSGQKLILRRNREAKNAAMILLRSGYHYGGLVEAVRILDTLRSGPDWSKTIDWLIRNKDRIISGTAELQDGISLLLSGRPAASVPFLVRYADTSPRSIEGRYWLGLAYYRDYFRTVRVGPETFLFSVDPLPEETSLPAKEGKKRRWELDFARTIWSGILQDSPSFSPAWNGLGRIALMDGHPRTSLKFFGRAAHLNPDSPWYSADYALGLWMRNHKVLGIRRWMDATNQAGYDPRLIYDQSILARMGGPLEPLGIQRVMKMPGWEFARGLRGKGKEKTESRPIPSFIGPILPAPILPGVDSMRVKRVLGIPTTAPIHSHRYLIWDYRFKYYRLAFRGKTLRLAEYFGKVQMKLPEYPPRPISKTSRKFPEDDPVEVIAYARIAFLRYQTSRHQWIVQRVDKVLDRFIVVSIRPDVPGGISPVRSASPRPRSDQNGRGKGRTLPPGGLGQ